MAANEVRLDDGFSTIIELEGAPTVKLYEKEVTPPGLVGGGPIDTTTMRNEAWRTKAPKQLKELGDFSAVCAFATDAIPILENQINVNQLVTVTFPDGSSLRFYGWLDSFVLGTFSEGEQPTATVTFHASLRDNDGNETPPVYEEPDGSDVPLD